MSRYLCHANRFRFCYYYFFFPFGPLKRVIITLHKIYDNNIIYTRHFLLIYVYVYHPLHPLRLSRRNVLPSSCSVGPTTTNISRVDDNIEPISRPSSLRQVVRAHKSRRKVWRHARTHGIYVCPYTRVRSFMPFGRENSAVVVMAVVGEELMGCYNIHNNNIGDNLLYYIMIFILFTCGRNSWLYIERLSLRKC